MSLVEAVKIIERRDGTPEEWDWELAEAALMVAKEVKRLWDREDAEEIKKSTLVERDGKAVGNE